MHLFSIIASELVIYEIQCIIKLHFIWSSYYIIAMLLHCMFSILQAFLYNYIFTNKCRIREFPPISHKEEWVEIAMKVD